MHIRGRLATVSEIWVRIALLGCVVAAQACTSGVEEARESTHTPDYGSILESVLSTDVPGFTTPTGYWTVDLPRDYAVHPDFQQDYWNFTGNLATPDARRFGFQWVVYRLGLVSPQEPAQKVSSAWRAKEIYATHFALTDALARRFLVDQRVSRAALGLSGSNLDPIRVWVEDWFLDHGTTPEGQTMLRIHMASNDVTIDLRLIPRKPAFVLSTNNGDESTASLPVRAFSLPRFQADGSVVINGVAHAVNGEMWMDRAWGRVPVRTGQLTLNRFLLRLSDGRDLMLTLLRRRGGGVPIYNGVIVNRDGSAQAIPRDGIRITATHTYRSPFDGLVYPSVWHIEIPGERFTADVAPLIKNQEILLWPRYWSGAVEVRGTAAETAVEGTGYVQLLGYVVK